MQFVTLPKFNIAPENRPSQKETSLPTTIFQGRAVKLGGCRFVLGFVFFIREIPDVFLDAWITFLSTSRNRMDVKRPIFLREKDIKPFCMALKDVKS